MAWTIEFSDTAARTLRKLDRGTSRRILDFLDARSDDPHVLGQALHGPLRRYWRYCVGGHRLVCDSQDSRFIVLVLDVGNRREIYR